MFVPYDQLSDEMGPLSRTDPRELGIVLVESPWKAERRPYHRQKLALVLANLRQFALEQAARGVAVNHVVTVGPYAPALAQVAKEVGPLVVMEPAERELREDLASLVQNGTLASFPTKADRCLFGAIDDDEVLAKVPPDLGRDPDRAGPVIGGGDREACFEDLAGDAVLGREPPGSPGEGGSAASLLRALAPLQRSSWKRTESRAR